MGEEARLVVVVLVLGVAGLGALLSRRLGRSGRVLDRRHGPFPGVFFFGSESCQACMPALAAIERSELDIRQLTWERDGELFAEWQIEEVPLLWVVDARGRIRTEIAGVPTARQLDRAKLQSSSK